MSDRALSREDELVVLLQSLDHHVGEDGGDTTVQAIAILTEIGGRNGHAGKWVLGPELLRVLQGGDQVVCPLLVGYLGQQHPEGADMFDTQAFLVGVKVVVELALRVPHHAVDASLQTEVDALVLEGNLLVVQDVADGGQVQDMQGYDGIEVHRIDRPLAFDVARLAGGHRDAEQSVRLLELLDEPSVVFLQDRHDLLQTLLVPHLVVELELHVGEKRGKDPLGVVGGQYRLAVLDGILAPDGTVIFLLLIEVVQGGKRRIVLVAVHKEKRAEATRELVEGSLARIGKILPLEPVLLRSRFPEFIDPDPGAIIHVDKILVIKMNKRHQILNQIKLLVTSKISSADTWHIF